MAQIIRFNERLISSQRIVWNLLIREGEAPTITMMYTETTGLLLNIHCSGFDQINDLKDTALKEAQKNAVALFGGEPITVRPILKTRKEG